MPLLPFLTRKRLMLCCIGFVVLQATLLSLLFNVDKNDGLKVFGSYWASGNAAAQGVDPYAAYPLTWITEFGVLDLNLNPPTLLPLLQAISYFEPVTGARVWAFAGLLLFLCTLAVLFSDEKYGRQRRQVGWVFLAPALLDTISLGQIYSLLFVFAVAGWLLLEKGKEVAAGVAIGLLVAVKPNFGVWILFLLLGGYWRAPLLAVITGFLLVGVSIAIYGPAVYLQWLSAVFADAHAMSYTDVSVQGYMARLGLPALGKVIAGALLLGSAVWVWRQRLTVLDTSKLAIIVAILASPLAWFHYTLFLLPAIVRNRWGNLMTGAALLLFMPVLIPIEAMRGPSWLAPFGGGIYFAGVCLMFLSFVQEIRAARSLQPEHSELLPTTHSRLTSRLEVQ